MKGVEVAAPGKLLVLTVVILGCFGFIIGSMVWNNSEDTVVAWVTIGSVVGYLTGNGVGAKKGQETVAPFVPAKDQTP